MELERRRARPAVAAVVCLALAACKEGLPVDLAPVAAPPTPVVGDGQEAAQQTVPEAPGGLMVAAAALSRAFVTSFAPFEAEARRLRTEDPRFFVQRNDWVAAGGRLMRSYPLASARFDYAHAAGLTGAGQTVAVIDSGFLASHEALRGLTLDFPLGVPAADDHGTAVASVIAGTSPVMTGAAPGASLMLSSFHSTQKLAEATRAAAAAGAVAQNNSWGFRADAGEAEFLGILAGTGYLEALIDYAADGVVVFAASNERGRTRSTLMEALPVFVPEVEAGWLAVVNAVPVYDDEGVVSAELVSAACLEAARWCLAADGAWIAAGSRAPDAYLFATGTSFAAPQVSGALALLAEAFPDLTPHELRARLLASADNGFFPHDGTLEIASGVFHGYSAVFGHGFLDLRAALLPIGTPAVPLVSGGTVAADRPVLRTGRAVGDTLARWLATHGVIATDALGAEFRIGAGALVARALPPPLAAERLPRVMGAGASAPGARTEAGALSLMSGRQLGFAAPDGRLTLDVAMPGAGDFGVVLRNSDPGRGLSLGVGLMRDGAGSLGVSGIGDGRALWAAVLDVEARMDLGRDAALTLFGQVGVQDGAGSVGFADVGPTRFTGFGADLSLGRVSGRGGQVTLGLALPTAVSAGTARMTLPVAVRDGRAAYERIGIGLAPEARERRLALGYAVKVGGGWRFSAEVVHAANRGHVAGRSETGAVFGLSARF